MTTEMPPKPRKLTPLLNQRKADILPLNDTNNGTSTLAILGTTGSKHSLSKKMKREKTMNKLDESYSLENISKICPTTSVASNNSNDAKKFDYIWDTKSFVRPPPPSPFNRKTVPFHSGSGDGGGGGGVGGPLHESSHVYSRSSLGGRISKNDNKEVEFQNLFKILHLNSNEIMNSYVYNNKRVRSDMSGFVSRHSHLPPPPSRSNFHKIKLQKSSSFVLNPTENYLSVKRNNSFTSY